jgi:hypothetical protein
VHSPNPREIEDHPLLVLHRLRQEESWTREDQDQDFRESISDPELLGMLLGQIDDGLGDNLGEETIEVESTQEMKPLLPLPAKPPAAPIAEEPLGESMQKLTEPRNPVRPPAPLPSWIKAEPLPEQDFDQQRPMVW